MRILLLFSLFISTSRLFSQELVNGNFENNTANGVDQINLTNDACNAMLPGVHAFGSYGDVDIIKSTAYGGIGAPDKDWYLGITGGGTDIIAMSLTQPLSAGKTYSLSFYHRKTSGYNAYPIQIGVSASNNSFGSVIYNSDSPSENWSRQSFTFTAPHSASYITVQMELGSISEWANIDGFVLGNTKCGETLSIVASAYTVNAGETVSLTAQGASTYSWTSSLLRTVLQGSIITVNPYENSVYRVMSKQNDCPLITGTVAISVVQPTVSYVIRDTTPVKPKVIFDREKLNGKRVVVRETVHRSENQLKVIIWDKSFVDGDKVSIYLNGKLLLKNYSLSKIKKEVVLDLEPGSNLLMMEAINEGTEPPNTAAIGINSIYNNILVTSDMKTVGAVEIIYTPVASN
jgi:hypothetical protein